MSCNLCCSILQVKVSNLLKRMPAQNASNALFHCIQFYVQYQRQCTQNYLRYFARLPLYNAIDLAARSVCPICGTMHGHQCHLGHVKCQSWANFLLSNSIFLLKLQQVNNFEDIKNLVEKMYQSWATAKHPSNNSLLVYDTAYRISACRIGKNIYLPSSFVHLHASAVINAIHGKQRGQAKGAVPIGAFLPVFQQNQMRAYEIEEFLCNFDDVLKKYSIPVI